MTFRGHIEGGRVILDEPANLPDGTAVEVAMAAPLSPKSKAAPRDRSAPAKKKRKVKTIYERYKSFIGIVKGLPSDLARNHDHYLHGAPKRED